MSELANIVVGGGGLIVLVSVGYVLGYSSGKVDGLTLATNIADRVTSEMATPNKTRTGLTPEPVGRIKSPTRW
jgi:hypothetical protein